MSEVLFSKQDEYFEKSHLICNSLPHVALTWFSFLISLNFCIIHLDQNRDNISGTNWNRMLPLFMSEVLVQHKNSLMSTEMFSKQDEYFDTSRFQFHSHVALTWLALGYRIHVAKQQICDYFMFSHVVNFWEQKKVFVILCVVMFYWLHEWGKMTAF